MHLTEIIHLHVDFAMFPKPIRSSRDITCVRRFGGHQHIVNDPLPTATKHTDF